jgi:hypothetical protein
VIVEVRVEKRGVRKKVKVERIEEVEEKVEVTIQKRKHIITKEKVEKSMKDLTPNRIVVYSVSINNKVFPIKQVISVTLGISPMEFGTSTAYQILQHLGFKIIEKS